MCACIVSDNGVATQKKTAQSLEDGWAAAPTDGPLATGSVRCRYSACQRSATVSEARRTFKTCHNCNHVYCSRRCRRAHWQDHRKTCLDRRTSTLCQSIVDTVKADCRCMERLSTIARRGYLTHGRGVVRYYFSGVELADRFVRNAGGGDMQCEPAYAKWTDIDQGLDELERLCKAYDPDTRFVLHVSVCVQSEVPGPGPVQWERHLVYKCVRLRLDKSLRAAAVEPRQPASNDDGDDIPASGAAVSAGGVPDTLILTSLPGYDRRDSCTARRVCFVNVQRHLRQRGVELRHQFPDVHRKLCEYVDGNAAATFTPVTLYPRDRASGKTFMCVIMPDTEPEELNLRLPPEDRGPNVQTIDVGREQIAVASHL